MRLRVRWNKNTSKNSLGKWGESKNQWKKVLLYHHISNSTSWLSFFIGILWSPRTEFKIWIWIWIWIRFLCIKNNMHYGKYSVVRKLEVKKHGGFCSAFCEMNPASLPTSIVIGSLSSVIGSVYCMFSIIGSLSSVIGSIYCTSSVIGSIYCTSSVILASTASPAS